MKQISEQMERTERRASGNHRSWGAGRSFLVLMLALAAIPLAAQSVMDVPLGDMVSQSGTIFVGTVIETEGGVDEHDDIVTWTTFRVDQPIRGTMPGEIRRIKQLGGEANGMAHYIEHMRYFQAGDQVLVMLYPESRLGFTSPVGLSQGAFDVREDGQISNLQPETIAGIDGGLLDRYGLGDGVPSAYPLYQFIELVTELVQKR